MVTSTSFLEFYASFVNRSRHEFVRIASELRANDLLPKHQDISPREAAILLLAFLVVEKPKDTVETLNPYLKLECKRIGELLVGNLAQILDDPKKAHRVEHITVCRNFPEAIIRHWSDIELKYEQMKEDLIGQPPTAPPVLRVEVTLLGGALHHLAVILKQSRGEDYQPILG